MRSTRALYFAVLTPLALTVLGAIPARADTIWIRSGNAAKSLPLPNIKVSKVENDQLTYVSEASGNESHKPLDSVVRIKLDDEPPFSAAEEAFDGGDFKTAVDGYLKALSATARPWVKVRSSMRLVDAGNKANNLPAIISGFSTLVTLDPVAASKRPIKVPADASKADLTAGITSVKSAVDTSGIKPDQREQLLNLLLQLQTAAKDPGASDTLKLLGKAAENSGGPTPSGSPAASPEGGRVKADVKLSEAKLALQNKNYKQAVDTIQGSSSFFVEPDQQCEALWIIAEGKNSLAGDDPKALADAGIAYMRVVANFKGMKDASHIADALLKTAQIEEKLGKPDEAMKAYQDIKEEYKDSPAAKAADEGIARTSAAIKAKG